LEAEQSSRVKWRCKNKLHWKCCGNGRKWMDLRDTQIDINESTIKIKGPEANILCYSGLKTSLWFGVFQDSLYRIPEHINNSRGPPVLWYC
jgi:hypothetical protein